MKKTGIAFSLGCALILSGCSGVGEGNDFFKDKTEVSVKSKIVEGVTTKEQLRTMFGAPDDISFDHNGKEVWNYAYAKIAGNVTTNTSGDTVAKISSDAASKISNDAFTKISGDTLSKISGDTVSKASGDAVTSAFGALSGTKKEVVITFEGDKVSSYSIL